MSGCRNAVEAWASVPGKNSTVADFQQTIEVKAVGKLDGWLQSTDASLVASFANGIRKDIDAVRNAISFTWSTKLKLIKRHERAKIDLLQARLVGATWNHP